MTFDNIFKGLTTVAIVYILVLICGLRKEQRQIDSKHQDLRYHIEQVLENKVDKFMRS